MPLSGEFHDRRLHFFCYCAGQRTSPIRHRGTPASSRELSHPFPDRFIHITVSEGIIKLDANKNAVPGPNFAKAQQLAAADVGGQDTFLLSPPKQAFPNNQLPLPQAGGLRRRD